MPFTKMEKFGLILFFGLLSISTIFIVVCASIEIFGEKEYVQKKIYVDAVYMHNRGNYSFMVVGEENIVEDIKLVDNRDLFSEPSTIILDVPKNEKCWVLFTGIRFDDKARHVKWFHQEIHLYSLDNIEGAEWNYGKFGSGRTVRIN